MVDAAAKYDTYSCDLNRILKYLCANIIHDRNYLPIKRLKQSLKIKKKIQDIEKIDSLHLQEDFPEAKLSYDLTAFEIIKHKISKCLLSLTYIGIKVLYLAIAVSQILLMNSFLSTKKHNFYGAEVLQTIVSLI